MSVESFLDSNVLLYAASKDPVDAAKSAMAARIMTETRFGISLQVVQEFYHNARIKARLGITKQQSERVIGLLLQRPFVITDGRGAFPRRATPGGGVSIAVLGCRDCGGGKAA
jgi:predicted nucleic acid-binding protein